MKRDLDLVRKILLACEAAPGGWAPNPLTVDGYDEECVGFHVYLMLEAGLLRGGDNTGLGDSSPMGFAGSMTWDGYEFLEASRDEERWSKVRTAAGTAGTMGFDVLKGVLVELGSKVLGSAMGLR